MDYKLIGKTCKVTADGIWTVSMRNDIGGSKKAPAGTYEVVIVKTWWDYETGQRCIGKCVNSEDVKRLKDAGKTEWKPKPRGIKKGLLYFLADAIVG